MLTRADKALEEPETWGILGQPMHLWQRTWQVEIHCAFAFIELKIMRNYQSTLTYFTILITA